MLAALDAHDSGGQSFDIFDVVELYPSDYVPGLDGFDPHDAEKRWCGDLGFDLETLSFEREFVGRGDIERKVSKDPNSVTATFSNVDRSFAYWLLSGQAAGKWLVVRVVSLSASDTIADTQVIFCGRVKLASSPGDVDDTSASLTAIDSFGLENQQFPPRTYGPNDSKGRDPADPLFDGFRFQAFQRVESWTTRERSASGFGVLLGLSHKVTHSMQASSQSGFESQTAVTDSFGRVQIPAVILAAFDLGNDINLALSFTEGGENGIDAYESVRQTNTKFSQPLGLVHRYGYPGGTILTTDSQVPIKQQFPDSDIPGDGYYSMLAWVGCYVQGSTPDVDEALAPAFLAVIKAKRILTPDGAGAFSVISWSDSPVAIARHILSNQRYFNEGDSAMQDDVNYDSYLYCKEYILDKTQGERTAIPQADAAQQGTAFQRFRSTGLVDSRRLRIEQVGDLGGDPPLLPAPVEPFDPVDPPGPNDPPTNPDAHTVHLRERSTCNVTITEKHPGVDFLYDTVAPTGRLYFVRNGKGRIEIRVEKPVDNTRIRGAVAAGVSTVKVTDVEPWITGPLGLTQRLRIGPSLTSALLTGAALTTSEIRDPIAAAYSADGNLVPLSVSTTGSVTASASGSTFSGGSSSTPASASITIGGTPAQGDTVTVTIKGIAFTYTLDSFDTIKSVAGMVAAFVQATPALRQFVKSSWDGSSAVVNLSIRYGVLTLSSALALPHAAELSAPVAGPTLTPAAGGTLPAGTLFVAYAYRNSLGNTTLSPVQTVTVTAGQKVTTSALGPLPSGVSSVDWYVSRYVNSDELIYHGNNDGSAYTIDALPGSTNELAPDINTTGEELLRVAASYCANDQDGDRSSGVFIPYPLWSASTPVALNAIYLPLTRNGHKYKVTTAGTTGSVEPAWPTAPGGTVTSGQAVFTEYGPTVLGQSGLTRGNIHAGTAKWPDGGKQSSVNKLKGSFYNSVNDFALTPLEVDDFDHQRETRKVNDQDVDLSGFDNLNQASRHLNFMLSKLRDGDFFVSLQTGPKGMLHEEGDVICVSFDNGGFVNVPVRIEELRIGDGPPKGTYNVQLTSRLYSTLMFSDNVRKHAISLPTTLRAITPLPTFFEFIDLGPVNDADAEVPGVYVVAAFDMFAQGSAKGWQLWGDFGAGYKKLIQSNLWGVLGTVSGTLAAGTSDTYYPSATITGIVLKRDGLDTTHLSQADLDADPRAHLVAYGGEYLQYSYGTLIDASTNTWSVTGLYRGRLSTNAPSHSAGERFAVMADAVLVELPVAVVNTPENFKGVTINENVSAVSPTSETWTGGTLKYPKPGISAAKDPAGNWHFLVFGRVSEDPEGDRYKLEIVGSPRAPWVVRGGVPRPVSLETAPTLVDPPSGGQGVYAASDIAGNTVTGSGLIYVQQKIQGEHTIFAATYSTTLTASSASPGSSVFFIGFADSGGIDFFLTVQAKTATTSSSLKITQNGVGTLYTDSAGEASGTRYSVEFVDGKVKFYRNRRPDSQPFYTFTPALTFPVEANIFTATSTTAADITIEDEIAALVYSVAEQAEDFGTAQASLTVRVCQQRVVQGQVIDGRVTEVSFP